MEQHDDVFGVRDWDDAWDDDDPNTPFWEKPLPSYEVRHGGVLGPGQYSWMSKGAVPHLTALSTKARRARAEALPSASYRSAVGRYDARSILPGPTAVLPTGASVQPGSPCATCGSRGAAGRVGARFATREQPLSAFACAIDVGLGRPSLATKTSDKLPHFATPLGQGGVKFSEVFAKPLCKDPAPPPCCSRCRAAEEAAAQRGRSGGMGRAPFSPVTQTGGGGFGAPRTSPTRRHRRQHQHHTSGGGGGGGGGGGSSREEQPAQRMAALDAEDGGAPLHATQQRFPLCITENRELNRPGTGVGYIDVPPLALDERAAVGTSNRGSRAFACAVPRFRVRDSGW